MSEEIQQGTGPLLGLDARAGSKLVHWGTHLIAAALRDPADLVESETFSLFLLAVSQVATHIPDQMQAYEPFRMREQDVAQLMVVEISAQKEQPLVRFSETLEERLAGFVLASGQLLLQWIETAPEVALAALAPVYDLLLRFAREIGAESDAGQPVREALALFWEGVVAHLIQTSQKQTPFLERVEHWDEQKLPTPNYYEDVRRYGYALSQLVRTKASGLGLHIRLFLVIRCGVSHLCDLYQGEQSQQQILASQFLPECTAYALQQMQQFDLYLEDACVVPLTGFRLRYLENSQEAILAQKTGRLPNYSYGPGPFTHEKQEQLFEEKPTDENL